MLHPMLAAIYKEHLRSSKRCKPFVADVDGDRDSATVLKNIVAYVKE